MHGATIKITQQLVHRIKSFLHIRVVPQINNKNFASAICNMAERLGVIHLMMSVASP